MGEFHKTDEIIRQAISNYGMDERHLSHPILSNPPFTVCHRKRK